MTKDNRYRLACCLLIFALALLLAKNILATPPVITLAVSPRVLLVSPGKEVTVRATIRIQKHRANRFLDLSWLDDGKSGSEQLPLDDNSPVTFVREVKLEQGEYNFIACLERQNFDGGKTYCTAEVSVQVQ